MVEACGAVKLLLWPIIKKEEEGADLLLSPTPCNSYDFRTEGLGPSFEHMGLWGNIGDKW